MRATENPNDLRRVGADDCEWVVGLLDTMAEGDTDATAETLEGLARRLRKASKARRLLTEAPAASIRAAFERRANRNRATTCR